MRTSLNASQIEIAARTEQSKVIISVNAADVRLEQQQFDRRAGMLAVALRLESGETNSEKISDIRVDISEDEYRKALNNGLVINEVLPEVHAGDHLRIFLQDQITGLVGSLWLPLGNLDSRPWRFPVSSKTRQRRVHRAFQSTIRFGEGMKQERQRERSAVNPTLAIRVLGEFEVVRGKTPQNFPKSRKTRALLGYLILTGRRHRRERLCDLLWDLPDDPRASLRWSLSRLRSLVDERGNERIIADREYVFFDPKGAAIDLLEIRRELAAGGANVFSTEHLLDLAAQFRGDLLEGLEITDHHDFGSWLLTERETARRTRASLLHILVNRLHAESRDEAVHHARDLVAADPYSVTAHATLIRILSATGHRDEAERQHEIGMKELGGAAPDVKALNEALAARRPAVRPAAADSAPRRLEQEIRFCSTSDGVRIAYGTVGEGPPLIKTANWLNHLEYDWESPIWRHVFRGLARDHKLIRYDARSNGLSDWDVDEISFDAFVRDLESVVDAAGVDRFPLLGISQGCAISIEYAIRNPGRVTRLVLHGGYARGWRIGADLAEIARREAMMTLILHGWGQDNPAFRQVFTSAFIPDGTPEQFRWMNELMRVSTSPRNAVRLQEALSTVDIRDRLPKVQVPTLVLHSRNDGRISYHRGLELAHGIPNARLITLESNNHLLLEHEAEFPRFMEAIHAFLSEK